MAVQKKNTTRKRKVADKSVKENTPKRKAKTNRKVVKGRRRKKKNATSNSIYSNDFPRIIRLLFFGLIMAFFIYQYYLLTKGELSTKILISGITLILLIGCIFVIGYKIGRRK